MFSRFSSNFSDLENAQIKFLIFQTEQTNRTILIRTVLLLVTDSRSEVS